MIFSGGGSRGLRMRRSKVWLCWHDMNQYFYFSPKQPFIFGLRVLSNSGRENDRNIVIDRYMRGSREGWQDGENEWVKKGCMRWGMKERMEERRRAQTTATVCVLTNSYNQYYWLKTHWFDLLKLKRRFYFENPGGCFLKIRCSLSAISWSQRAPTGLSELQFSPL